MISSKSFPIIIGFLGLDQIPAWNIEFGGVAKEELLQKAYLSIRKQNLP